MFFLRIVSRIACLTLAVHNKVSAASAVPVFILFFRFLSLNLYEVLLL